MKFDTPTVEFDHYLLEKYDRPLPRYTSYPPASEFKPNFDQLNFRGAIALGNYKKTPLSLYCHIPFCETACYFCGCNTIITQRKEIAEVYLNHLIEEITSMAELIDGDRLVNQLHWGGGTPNYLSFNQIERLWAAINQHFRFDNNAEISIEVNPRFIDKNYLLFLSNLGFNRISFGIQDFDLKVQQAINRIQSETMLFNVMDWIRSVGFKGVNVDLIYGLPFQSLDSFKKTVTKAIELSSDRLAVFNFAFVPSLKPIQKKIPQEALLLASEKLDILQMTIEELTGGGYVFIGMDHFALPNDELAIAQREGKLHRNFQGYTTKPESDLLAFGLSSISMLHDVYVQNHKRLKDYYQAIESKSLPIEKGVSLHKDDIIRRQIIMELMCQFRLSKTAFQEVINFDDYFAVELAELELLETDGLVRLTPDSIEVTPTGRLLIRNIVSIFDTYLRGGKQFSFSKSI